MAENLDNLVTSASVANVGSDNFAEKIWAASIIATFSHNFVDILETVPIQVKLDIK